MRKLTSLMLYTVITVIVWSCQKEKVADQIPIQEISEPTKPQLNKLCNMGINTSKVTIQDVTFIDGSSGKHLVAGDIMVPINGLNEYPELKPVENNNKQFQTANLVSIPYRNINILGYTGNGFALTSKMQTALRWAVANYNEVGTTIRFNLTFGTNYTAADMVVYAINEVGIGGSAGILDPSGRPYKWIRVNLGTNAYSINVNEHVIGHEIAHCIGFRHQDWYNHQSCGYSGPLPAEPLAIWIEGTPWSPYEDSITLTCFDTGTDGELSPSDILALNILY
ncbi:M57 family metalloprotease [Aquimarina sediminis]|uniref:M57 family metalloprotease n=1 Tax=Aquimarina sediminis TaxID=2070536 RepID=UPI000CA05197|nr:M57 family metalloprotease [Aquimarina sediminis]